MDESMKKASYEVQCLKEIIKLQNKLLGLMMEYDEKRGEFLENWHESKTEQSNHS